MKRGVENRDAGVGLGGGLGTWKIGNKKINGMKEGRDE